MDIVKKNSIASILLAVLLLFAAAGQAQALKLGYVNTPRLLEEAPQAERGSAVLKTEFSGREEKLIENQKALQSLEEKLKRDGAIMNESERQKLGMDILNRQRELRREQQALAEDLNMRRSEIIGELQKDIQKAIEKIGKKGGYDLILYEGIAYESGKFDLTDQVLEELKK